MPHEEKNVNLLLCACKAVIAGFLFTEIQLFCSAATHPYCSLWPFLSLSVGCFCSLWIVLDFQVMRMLKG